MSVFCERLVALLKERKIDNKQIERDLSLPKDSVYNWTHGVTKSYTKFVSKIASYLGVSTLYLLGETDDPQIKTPAASGDGRVTEFEKAVNLLFADNPEKLSTLLDALANEPEKTKAKFDLFLATL